MCYRRVSGGERMSLEDNLRTHCPPDKTILHHVWGRTEIDIPINIEEVEDQQIHLLDDPGWTLYGGWGAVRNMSANHLNSLAVRNPYISELNKKEFAALMALHEEHGPERRPFEEVAVRVRGGHVVGLDLWDYDLKTIPEQLREFPQLEKLWLAHRLKYAVDSKQNADHWRGNRKLENIDGLQNLSSLKELYIQSDHIVWGGQYTTLDESLFRAQRVEQMRKRGVEIADTYGTVLSHLDAGNDFRVSFQNSPVLQNIDTDLAVLFEHYDGFMNALGAGVEDATCFADYDVVERLNTSTSLNPTFFLHTEKEEEDGEYLKAFFVKFMGDKSRWLRETRIHQSLAANSNFVDSVQGIDLSDNTNTYVVLDAVSKEYKSWRRKKQSSDDELPTTTVCDVNGSSLRYVIIGGENDDVLPGFLYHQRIDHPLQCEETLKCIIDDLFVFHGDANRIISSGEMEIERKNYHANPEEGTLSPKEVTLLQKRRLIRERLQEYAQKEEYVSFIHGDLHLGNVLRKDAARRWSNGTVDRLKRGGSKFIDFDFSVEGLKIEDLVRIHDFPRRCYAQNEYSEYKRPNHNHSADDYANVAERVKKYFFTKAFGEEHNKHECEEMFALISAEYWIEYVRTHQQFEASYNAGDSILKQEEGIRQIERNLTPYMPAREITEITDALIALKD
jgi:hypothetical protein